MQEQYETLRAAGGEVLAVSFTPPERVAAYLARHPLPFPALSDPSLAVYRAFGLGRTSWRALLRPGVVLGFLKLLLRGGRLEKPGEGEDVLQLGGDFVLDPQRRLVYAYRSRTPTDRPPVHELVQAVRDAAKAA